MKDLLKAVKERNKEDIKFEIEWIYQHYIWWPWRYITVAFWERLGRALDAFMFCWRNHDWDAGFMHQLLLWKLKRMRHCFIHYGHHSEGCQFYLPKMKSLNLTIKLLESALNDNWWRDEMDAWPRQKLYDYMDMDESKKEKRLILAHKIIAKYHNYWWD